MGHQRLRQYIWRIATAASALTGKLDFLPALSEKTLSLENSNRRLRILLREQTEKTNYWFELHKLSVGQFAAGQELLVAKIDDLRKKCGEWDGKSFYENLEQKAMQNFLGNEHPHSQMKGRVPADIKIDVPPVPPEIPPEEPNHE